MAGKRDDVGSTTGSFPSGSSMNLLRCVYTFEGIDETLPYIPLGARRVLDSVGRKLSLEGWLSLHLADRKVLLLAGAAELIDSDVAEAVLSRANPQATPMAPLPPPSPLLAPAELANALGAQRPLRSERWAALRSVDRYIFAKLAANPEKLVRAYDEIIGPRVALTHLNDDGEAHMVDVGAKGRTMRRAVATARVNMSTLVLERLTAGDVAKGDVLAVARIAGIQAAKRTHELIPLCHLVALTRVEVSFAMDHGSRAVHIHAMAEAIDRTGVEMEALVAASTAALTIYDMLKGVDRWMTITDIRLEEKTGGRSGDARRPADPATR